MIESACREMRQVLDERGEMSAELAAHLSGCAGCRRHASLLATFARVRPGEADERAVSRIMAALPAARWQQRRVLSWLPAAAAIALVGIGLALVGGLPAAAALGALPPLASGLLGWTVTWALDAMTALEGGSQAAQALIAAQGLWIVAWLLLTAAGGGWAVHALARRRREEP